MLDEPTNHLDIKSVEWLEGFLSSFSGAFIVISHDRYFLDRVTDKTIEIENKKMRSYKGNYSEFLVKKQAEQKAIAEKYENDMKEIERLEGIIAQQRQWNREKNIKTAESKEKVIERIKAQLVVPDAKLKKSASISLQNVFPARMCLMFRIYANPSAIKKYLKMQAFPLKRETEFFSSAQTVAAKPPCLK